MKLKKALPAGAPSLDDTLDRLALSGARLGLARYRLSGPATMDIAAILRERMDAARHLRG